MKTKQHSLLIVMLTVFGFAAASSCASQSSTVTREEAKTGGAEKAGEQAEQAQVPLFEGLDVHDHEISTDVPEAQTYFDQGLVLSFGFNHAEAARSFRQAAQLDPTCAMCFWGEALVLGPNINAAMPPENVEPAWEAIQKAQQLAEEHATPREQAYIEALSERYAADPPEDRSQLDRAYAEATGELAQAYPDDLDAAALYAEALMDEHPWDYWTEDGEPRPWTPEIVEVLEDVLDEARQHPMANHLYIHAVEASPNPERALASARRLEDLVPGAGHLVHMPAHIYIRTGRYHEASEANERAAATDERYVAQCHAAGIYPLGYHPHNYHFLWATTTLEGRSEDAIAAGDQVRAMVDPDMMRKSGFGALQHFYSIPYYADVTFGKWEQILDEPAPADDLLYPTGVWHFARGMALDRTDRLDEAREELDELSKLADDESLEEITLWEINTTADLLEIGEEVLSGEMEAARGNYDEAVEHLRRGVELEDALNYNEPPPWGQSVRRYLGAVLLQADRPGEAEEVYRADLAEFPKNGWALYGLTQALEAQAKSEEADDARERFEQAWKHSDVELSASRL
jgi:tetratricopeptide (TPR) repeat protein